MSRRYGIVWLTVVWAAAVAAAQAEPAREILDTAGVRGGLVVHVGCDDGTFTAALRAGESYLVQGLATDPQRVDRARQTIQALGTYGPVSVSSWDGRRLPYAGGVVNLIVVDGRMPAPLRDEVDRVLAPGGAAVALDAQHAILDSFRKPWPDGIDQWTHYRHDPTNRNVAQDRVIGPPRSIKWRAGPDMLRHHDHLPSLSAMVSAEGRVFYIFDEGPASSIMLPPKWRLVARDAFSGVLLWKKTIDRWHPHLWPLKSMPATLPRRLVAVGDGVFATLGIDAPVSQLNAADGSVIQVFENSDRCEEILVHGDTLLALRLVGKGPLDDMDGQRWDYLDGRVTKFPYAARLAAGIMSPQWLHADRRLVAYDVRTGRPRWQYDGHFAPLSLATDGQRVFFHDGKAIIALDFQTGRKIWTSEDVPVWKEYFSWYGASLVVADDVVLFSGGENMTWIAAGTPGGGDDTLTAFSAVDGKRLWSARHPPSGYRSPEDLIVAQGLVWTYDCTKKASSAMKGLDLHTGAVVREFDVDYTHGFHHRCYPGRATERFLMLSKVGMNLIGFRGELVDHSHWVRGACGYGFMPANGMIYATPDPCNCYPESKLNGFVALAPETDRLHLASSEDFARGRAYESVQGGSPTALPPDCWPTYRHDAARSGATGGALPEQLRPSWTTRVGAAVSAPVIAGGRVFVASVRDHRLVALDAETGAVVWSRTVGGRVDSPPTIVRIAKGVETVDCLLFGCTDGWMYCLAAADGQSIWRRRLAPTPEQIVSDDDVESVWPLHGSVLHYNGLAYGVAGRSAFVDGGIHLVGLDPITGDVRFRENRSLQDQTIRGMNTEPAKPDVLAASGDNIFLRSMSLDLRCRPAASTARHIFASNGFLDDRWFHRAFWVYGTSFAGGAGGFGKTGQSNPSGRIMVADDAHVYGFGRTKYGWGSAFQYQLYAAPTQGPTAAADADGKRARRRAKAAPGKRTVWAIDAPILARAMVKAGGELLVAGPEKRYEELEEIQRIGQADAQAEIRSQAQAWHGDAELLGVAAADGTHVRHLELSSMPVWDGMAVADGSLYIACEDGTVRRFEQQQ